MGTRHVSVSRRKGVLVIRFINDKARNAMTVEMRSQLSLAVQRASRDADVRVIYITGTGAAFCAGGDLSMLKNACEPWQVHRRFRQLGSWLLPLIQIDKPVIVGVNGVTVGGGIGIALTGDMVVAAESASFVPGFFRLGVVPDVATMYTLPRVVGLAKAKQFLFGGETLNAAQALDFGLVSRVVPDKDLDRECLKLAHELSKGPAEVIGLAKLLMSRTLETGVSEMFLLEGLGQALGMSSPEFREGLAALLERRSPNFQSAVRAADGT